MSVMTPARTAPTTGYRPRSLNYLTLSPNLRDQVDGTLRDLGIDDAGYTTLDGGVPNAGYRIAISAALAAQLGLHLPHGHELALCHDCQALGDADDMRESYDGAWRCTDTDPHGDACHTLYAAEHDAG